LTGHLTAPPSPSTQREERSRPSTRPGNRASTPTWEERTPPPTSSGQHLFDSRHGVVVVEDTQTRVLNGQPTTYVAVRTLEGNLRILLPLASAAESSLRRLISTEEASAVFAELGAVSQPMPDWTSQSFAELQRKTVGRNPLFVAGAVRDLAAKGAGARLRPNEQTLLTKATELLAAELAIALELTRRQALACIEAALEHGRRPRTPQADPGSPGSPAPADGGNGMTRLATPEVA
jgi:CarD family transcriptional regulator, regulator of rRNA transcription